MSQIDKYETYRAIACLIISISTLISETFVCKFIESYNLALIVTFVIGFVGCSLVNLSFKICEKKIEKYKKEHGEELSFESSQL